MRLLLRLLFVCVAFVCACKDSGVVGRTSACAKPCAADKLCHPTLATCVSCIQDRDCAGKGDGDKPRCDTHDFSCVECKSASDCALDKPYCVQGKCEASPSDDKQSSPSDDHSGDHAAAGAGFSDDHSGAGTGN